LERNVKEAFQKRKESKIAYQLTVVVRVGGIPHPAIEFWERTGEHIMLILIEA
jgi:hypothetical protein